VPLEKAFVLASIMPGLLSNYFSQDSSDTELLDDFSSSKD
jgi:hypothetical protein